ncbi:hypothetical protein D3C76_1466290 [compost metagenome]
MTIGEEVDFLFREVDRRFDIDPQTDQLLGEVMHTCRKCALQRPQGITSCLGRTGFNQVGNGFGLGQIKLVVEEGAFAEFPRSGKTAAQFQAALEQHIQNNGSTVALKFQHVFTGKRVWSREIQGDALVQYFIVFSEEGAIVG